MNPRWLFGALTTLSALWAVSAYATSTRAGETQAAPAQSAVVAASGDYVGAARCGTCHSEVHAMWTRGRHSKMVQPASAAAVVGDFSRRPVTLRGTQYQLAARNGAFFISAPDAAGELVEHRVEYTLGSRRIQHYLTTTANGQIVVLPPTWDVQRREWFHNNEIVQPTDDDRSIVQQWNRNCVGCHVSGQENRYDPVARTYRSSWTDFGTSCERCHGPGARHAQTDGSDREAARASIIRPTRLDPGTNSMVCAQCHSLRTVIDPGYTPGADYFDYFLPALEYAQERRSQGSRDPAYWSDGRPRRFSNDAIGLWQSACFIQGGATCTTCHTNPHLPNVDTNPQLAGSSSDTLCASCHQEIARERTEHTRHLASSPGSTCVECHMPKTVVGIKATMRDHSMSVPAPENTVKFDIPNACTECHRDKPATWAVGVLRSWRPVGRRQRLIAQAEAFTAARAGRADAIDSLLAISQDRSYPPFARANAVGYLGRFADPRATSAVVAAARSDEPVMRMTAVAALRGPAGTGEPSRAAIVSALDDSLRTVRITAAVTVVERSSRDLQPGDRTRFLAVAAELLSWTRRHQDDAVMQRLQGIVQLLGGEVNSAAEALAISLAHDPETTQTKFLLGLARLGQGRRDEARRLWREIPRGDQFYESAQRELKALGAK